MSLSRTASNTLLRRAASQTNTFKYPKATISFPLPNTVTVQKAKNGDWPVEIEVHADSTPGAISLKLPEVHKEDVLGLTRVLQRKLFATVSAIDGVSLESAVPAADELAQRLSNATSFTVHSQKVAKRVAQPTASKAQWGATNPVIGTVTVAGTTPAELEKSRVFFVLYNTPALKNSVLLSNKGRLIVSNLHPLDVVRIRRICGRNVSGIRISERVSTLEKLFPNGIERRHLVGKLLSAVRGERLSAKSVTVKKITVVSAADAAVAGKKPLRQAAASAAKGAIQVFAAKPQSAGSKNAPKPIAVKPAAAPTKPAAAPTKPVQAKPVKPAQKPLVQAKKAAAAAPVPADEPAVTTPAAAAGTAAAVGENVDGFAY